jgi:hypothetical protein
MNVDTVGGKTATATERTPLNGLGRGDGGVCGWEEGEAGSHEWGLARAQCALMARACDGRSSSRMRRAPALDGTEAEGGVERMDGHAGRLRRLARAAARHGVAFLLLTAAVPPAAQSVNPLLSPRLIPVPSS